MFAFSNRPAMLMDDMKAAARARDSGNDEGVRPPPMSTRPPTAVRPEQPEHHEDNVHKKKNAKKNKNIFKVTSDLR